MLVADLDVTRERADGVVMGWIHSTKEREGPGRVCQHGQLVLHVQECGQLLGGGGYDEFCERYLWDPPASQAGVSWGRRHQLIANLRDVEQRMRRGWCWSHHAVPPNAILSLAPCWAARGSLPRPGSHSKH